MLCTYGCGILMNEKINRDAVGSYDYVDKNCP